MRPTVFHRPLHKIAPEVTNVLRDPVTALSARPLVIGDRLLTMLLVLSGGAGVLFFMPLAGPKVILGRILYGALALVIPFVAIARKRQVILNADGIEYAYGRKSVFIPWAAVDRSAATVSQADVELKLPILPAALDAIEHRRDGVAVAYGTGSRSLWLKVTADGLAMLRAPLGVSPVELGELIMRLARSGIAGPGPAPTGPPAVPEAAVCRRLSDREVEILLTHLDLPPVCCECERPTDARLRLTFREQTVQWPYPTFATGGGPRREELVVTVPYCPECQARSRRRGWARTAALAVLLGLPLWGLFLALWLNGDLSADAVPAIAVIAVFWTVAGLVGCAMSGLSLWAWPAVRGHLPLERPVVRLRFLRPTYADRLCEWLTQRNGSGIRQAIHTPNGSELI